MTKIILEKIEQKYDFSKPAKKNGEIRKVKCKKCGEETSYLWLPGYYCPRLGYSNQRALTKIISGSIQPRAGGKYCPNCKKRLKEEIINDSPGTTIMW